MENKDFAERNVGLVRALVPRFLGRGIEYDDLFQAGCEGLIKAAAHFDPDRGYEIDRVRVDGDSERVRSSYTFEEVTENHTIRVTFTETDEGGDDDDDDDDGEDSDD